MRTKQFISGLNNNQKIRFIVGDFVMYCRVKDVQNIGSITHRKEIESALLDIVRWKVNGHGHNRSGLDVQVDLMD